ncbi:hypothetical protein F5Y07DRAFT_412355 [Xylaria sp. FL0933]|nr:hypothetical protein F5Y07DRAFT_412355 [Xylaria sp. FL0933]
MCTNPRARVDQLTLGPISKNSKQRRGRCGRTAPGYYFACFTKQFFDTSMRDTAVPAILREPVADVYLKIKAAANSNPLSGKTARFDWLDPPSPEQHIACYKAEPQGLSQQQNTL